MRLNEGLQAYYPLRHDCNDAVGQHDGTAVGSVTFGEDGGRAAHFTTSSYCKVDSFKNYAWGSALSVCTWARRTGATGAYMGVVSTGQHVCAWEIRVGRENCASGTCTQLGGGVVTQQHSKTWDATEVEMAMDEWVHICMTYDGSQLKFYTDKVMQAVSENDSGGLKIVDQPMYIGTASASGESFHGDIAMVRIYDRALSASEVVAIHDQEEPSLSFNEGLQA